MAGEESDPNYGKYRDAHLLADTDTSPEAIHHSLGSGANQAAPGTVAAQVVNTEWVIITNSIYFNNFDPSTTREPQARIFNGFVEIRGLVRPKSSQLTAMNNDKLVMYNAMSLTPLANELTIQWGSNPSNPAAMAKALNMIRPPTSIRTNCRSTPSASPGGSIIASSRNIVQPPVGETSRIQLGEFSGTLLLAHEFPLDMFYPCNPLATSSS